MNILLRLTLIVASLESNFYYSSETAYPQNYFGGNVLNEDPNFVYMPYIQGFLLNPQLGYNIITTEQNFFMPQFYNVDIQQPDFFPCLPSIENMQRPNSSSPYYRNLDYLNEYEDYQTHLNQKFFANTNDMIIELSNSENYIEAGWVENFMNMRLKMFTRSPIFKKIHLLNKKNMSCYNPEIIYVAGWFAIKEALRNIICKKDEITKCLGLDNQDSDILVLSLIKITKRLIHGLYFFHKFEDLNKKKPYIPLQSLSIGRETYKYAEVKCKHFFLNNFFRMSGMGPCEEKEEEIRELILHLDGVPTAYIHPELIEARIVIRSIYSKIICFLSEKIRR